VLGVRQPHLDLVVAPQLAVAAPHLLAEVAALGREELVEAAALGRERGALLAVDLARSEPLPPALRRCQPVGQQQVPLTLALAEEAQQGRPHGVAVLGRAHGAELVGGPVPEEAQRPHGTSLREVEREDGDEPAVRVAAPGNPQRPGIPVDAPPGVRPLPGREQVAAPLGQRVPLLAHGGEVVDRLEGQLRHPRSIGKRPDATNTVRRA
jgi:hypothetical protein